MDKDFIWEGRYNNRSSLKEALKELLGKQDADSLQMASVFVNNNPYNLELYVAVSYNQPQKSEINYMITLFKDASLLQRKDLTIKELCAELGNRRFQWFTFVGPEDVDIVFDTVFFFPESQELEKKGYITKPFNQENTVFISHSNKDSNEVEEIIPYLNGQGLSIWFDQYSIAVGSSITDAVQKGIEKSKIVIMWITENFIQSKWCNAEMHIFVKKLVEEECLIISVLDSNVENNDLPLFLRDIKYISRKNKNTNDIAQEIIMELKKSKRI